MGSGVAARGELTRLSGARSIVPLLAVLCLGLIFAAFAGMHGVSSPPTGDSFGAADARMVPATSSEWSTQYSRDISGGSEDGESRAPAIPQPGDVAEPSDDIHDTFGVARSREGRILRPDATSTKPGTTVIDVRTGEKFLARLLRGPPAN